MQEEHGWTGRGCGLCDLSSVTVYLCDVDVDIPVKDNLSWEILMENIGTSEYFTCLSGTYNEQGNLCTEPMLCF